MTNISPLGVIYISLCVAQWNNSTDIKRKWYVRRLLTLEKAVQSTKAICEINCITDAIFEKECGAIKHTEMNIGLIAVALSGATEFKPEAMAHQNSLIDKAKTDLALYFAEAFKAGHFKQLPVPEFGYRLPDLGDDGTVEGALAAAKTITEHLPSDLGFTIPPQQKENPVG